MSDATRLTPLAVAILNLLDEREMHPYDMIQLLQSRHEDEWVKVRPGSLYHQVERLAELGLVEVVGTDQDGRRPQRTTYRITPAGLDELQEWVSDRLRHLHNAYPCFPLALGQLASLPRERARADLTARASELDARIQYLTHLSDEARAAGSRRIWLLAHEYSIDALRAERRFVGDLLTDIEQEELTWP